MTSDEPANEQAELDLAWNIPLVAMVPISAVFSALMVWAFGLDLVLISLLPFAVLLGVITVIDLRELRVPNRLVAPGVALGLPLLLLASLSDWPELSFWRALIGGAAMFGGYLLLALVVPGGMGLGDVKLSPIIGAQLALFGWIPFGRGLVLAFFIVGPVTIVLLLTRKAKAKSGLPFAPFMALGAFAALTLHGLGL